MTPTGSTELRSPRRIEPANAPYDSPEDVARDLLSILLRQVPCNGLDEVLDARSVSLDQDELGKLLAGLQAFDERLVSSKGFFGHPLLHRESAHNTGTPPLIRASVTLLGNSGLTGGRAGGSFVRDGQADSWVKSGYTKGVRGSCVR